MSRAWSEREREQLASEIAGLQLLEVEQLKARWRALYQTEAPTRFSRDLLMRAVAYRISIRVAERPVPKSMRPSLTISSTAARSATRTGWLYWPGNSATAWLIRIRLVR
jgi:hypothetical protein